jgi:hypothetical protein
MRFVDTARFWPVAAAVVIQSWWRGRLAYQEAFKLRNEAAAKHQLKNVRYKNYQYQRHDQLYTIPVIFNEAIFRVYR